MSMRTTTAFVLLALVVVSCGGSKPAQTVIAQVGSRAISLETFQQNLSYAIQFYQSTYGNQSSLSTAQCSQSTAACAHLRNQLLRRLLEQEVVIAYAESHHIGLSTKDQSLVSAQLARATIPGSVIAQLVSRKVISRQFLRALIQNERLVHNVETRIVPASLSRGFAYHLRSVLIPFAARGHGRNAYRMALSLATDGRPIPRRARVHVSWILPRRLASNVRKLVEVTQRGQFVGPFKRHRAFLVVQLLGSGTHRLGRAARLARQTSYFRHWIARMLATDRPVCFDNNGKSVACPGPID